MRNLRLYSTDAEFKTNEQNAGGDGSNIVTIVPGISKTNDERKSYFNQHNDIEVLNIRCDGYVTATTKSVGNTTYAKIKHISGTTEQVNLNYPAYTVDGFAQANSFVTITVPTQSAATFYYVVKNPENYVEAKYNITETGSATKIYNKSNYYADTFAYMELDGVILSAAPSFTFSTAGEHTVKFFFSGSPDNTFRYQSFQTVTALTEFTFHKGVTNIQSSFFNGCTNLKKVNFPNTPITLNDYCFQNSGIEEFTIRSNMSLNARVFYQARNLTSITIEDGVTTLTTQLFGYTDLKTISIPDSVTEIGNYCFQNNTGLTEITLPKNLSSLGGGVFSNCSGLTKITSLATTAPSIRYDAFQNVPYYGTLYYPTGSDYTSWFYRSSSYYTLGTYRWSSVKI